MKPNYSQLIKILKQKRPAGSPTEGEFAKWICETIKGTFDDYGNVWRTVGTNSRTLFTSHTDTVHYTSGIQELGYDSALNHIVCNDKTPECLGADDGTGVWLMLHMIQADVPGTYVFFRDEEVGGRGSKHFADKYTGTFERCISFDRKGYTDVITHQGGTRTCSNTFANALSAELNKYIPGFKPCDAGVFTDSKNLRGRIPECTNLSVGYFKQHTASEYQDVKFLIQLANAVCRVKWDELPTVRDCKAAETPSWGSWTHNSMMENNDKNLNYFDSASFRDIYMWVRKHPASAAVLLHTSMDVTLADLLYAEDEYKNNADYRKVVQQCAKSLRDVPSGGTDALSGQNRRNKERKGDARKRDSQSDRTVPAPTDKRTAARTGAPRDLLD